MCHVRFFISFASHQLSRNKFSSPLFSLFSCAKQVWSFSSRCRKKSWIDKLICTRLSKKTFFSIQIKVNLTQWFFFTFILLGHWLPNECNNNNNKKPNIDADTHLIKLKKNETKQQNANSQFFHKPKIGKYWPWLWLLLLKINNIIYKFLFGFTDSQ